jgi:hypothetical protein
MKPGSRLFIRMSCRSIFRVILSSFDGSPDEHVLQSSHQDDNSHLVCALDSRGTTEDR